MIEEQTRAPSKHWPSGVESLECKCPHCGHIDMVQIAIVREMGVDFRDGECSACFGDYIVEAKGGVVTTVKLPRDSQTHLIQHHYDIGDQGVTVKVPHGFDAKRAAVYMQFQAEEWFGTEKMVTNLGIAAALVSFYGCEHTARNRFGEVIDMYYDREKMCPKAAELMADASLAREGLREFLSTHLDG